MNSCLSLIDDFIRKLLWILWCWKVSAVWQAKIDNKFLIVDWSLKNLIFKLDIKTTYIIQAFKQNIHNNQPLKA